MCVRVLGINTWVWTDLRMLHSAKLQVRKARMHDLLHASLLLLLGARLGGQLQANSVRQHLTCGEEANEVLVRELSRHCRQPSLDERGAGLHKWLPGTSRHRYTARQMRVLSCRC